MIERFGSWNAALRAADLPLNTDRDPATSEAMAQAHCSGLTYREIAADHGCAPATVRKRVRRLGSMSVPQDAAPR